MDGARELYREVALPGVAREASGRVVVVVVVVVKTEAANFSCVLFCPTCVFVCHRLRQADIFHVPSFPFFAFNRCCFWVVAQRCW